MVNWSENPTILGYDAEGAKGIASFFANLELPLPVKNEFYRAQGRALVPEYGRRLVFLTDLGIVIRVTPESKHMPEQDHPCFLPSLYRRQEGIYQIDIDPGGMFPVPSALARDTYRTLRRQYGIIDTDAFTPDGMARNLVLIPGTQTVRMIDLDPQFTKVQSSASDRAHLSDADVEALLAEERAINDKAYRPLQAAIKEAWPQDSEHADPQRIKSFFNLCRDFKTSGRLVAAWQRENYNNTTYRAEDYTKRLRSVGFTP